MSDQIRALDAASVPRAEIAKFLGKRYQHVRNVLEGDKLRGRPATDDHLVSGVEERGEPFVGQAIEEAFVQARGDGAYRLTVRADGSVILPKEVREAFGVEGGGVVMARLEGDTFGLISSETAIRRIRALVRQYVPPGVDLVAELLADRRAEAQRERDGD